MRPNGSFIVALARVLAPILLGTMLAGCDPIANATEKCSAAGVNGNTADQKYNFCYMCCGSYSQHMASGRFDQAKDDCVCFDPYK